MRQLAPPLPFKRQRTWSIGKRSHNLSLKTRPFILPIRKRPITASGFIERWCSNESSGNREFAERRHQFNFRRGKILSVEKVMVVPRLVHRRILVSSFRQKQSSSSPLFHSSRASVRRSRTKCP